MNDLRQQAIEALVQGDTEALKAMKPAIESAAELEAFMRPYTDKQGKVNIPVEKWIEREG